MVDTEEEIILCVLCGINGTHLQCSSLTLDQAEDWKCGDCGGEADMEVIENSSRDESELPSFLIPHSSFLSSLDISSSNLSSDLDITSDNLPDVNEFLKRFQLKSPVSKTLDSTHEDQKLLDEVNEITENEVDKTVVMIWI